MKKLMLGSILVVGTIFIFNACSKQKDDESSASTSSSSSSESSSTTNNQTDAGVVINGVKWGTRNVSAPGTFATNSYDAGDFYQWNSKVGWPSSGAIGSISATDGTTTWNNSWAGGYTTPSSSDTWTSANDPSPVGWRVPTFAEIKTLLDTTKVTNVWTTKSGMSGRKFTDKTTGNSLFLPASGWRDGDGTLGYTGLYGNGYYWTRTADGVYGAYYLTFDCGIADYYYNHRACGQFIRPVAK